MSIFKSKPDARQLLTEVPEIARNLFNNVAALRETVEGWEAVALARAQHSGPNGLDPWAPAQYRANLLNTAHEHWAPARAVLDSLEGSADYIAAAKIIVPILKAVAELEVAEEAARQELQRKKSAVAEALEKANARALSLAAKDPDVLKAKQELDALNAV